MGCAMRFAFDSDRNRPSVPDVMVVLTDGNSNIRRIREQHDIAVARGIQLVAIGVTNGLFLDYVSRRVLP